MTMLAIAKASDWTLKRAKAQILRHTHQNYVKVNCCEGVQFPGAISEQNLTVSMDNVREFISVTESV